MAKRIYKKAVCKYCEQNKFIAAKGLCRACYYRAQRNGTPDYQPARVRGVCEVSGCGKPHMTGGLCDMHRKRKERHGHTEQTRPQDWGEREKHSLYKYWSDNVRRTSFSLSDEWFNDFWRFVDDVKERPSNHHLRPIRKNAALGPTNWEWVKGKELKAKPRKRVRLRKHRKRVYITSRQRQLMYEDANYCCEICGKHEQYLDPVTGTATKSLAIDHCHKTLKIRGVLCAACNKLLGHAKDNIETLQKAIDYLKAKS